MFPRRTLAVLAAALIGGSTLAAPSASAADGPTDVGFSIPLSGETGGAFGYAASRTSCDVNGDGSPDTVVGDWGWDRPGYTNTGAGYVVLGGTGLRGGDVADPDSGAIRIDGPSVTVTGGAWIGWSATCLGDVNGDGYDDIALGSGSRNYQRVHVILGRADFSAVDLDNLGSRGFVIEDSGALSPDLDNFGYWVGEVGDVNGDGYADIGIGDILADNNGRSNSGRVWIIAGSDSVANVDLVSNTSRVLRTIDGQSAEERLATVATAGDVNADGVDDFVVGSYTATPWGSSVAVPGAAYVVYGNRSASGSVDLGALGAQGFAVYGSTRQRDRLGTAVAAAGDVNGDGYGDLLIGGDGVTNAATGDRNGGVAVVFGGTTNNTVLTDPASSGATVYTCADGAVDTTCSGSSMVSRGYWINGQVEGAKIGWAVAGVGDVNGDGVPDALVGGSAAGQTTWLVYGSADDRSTVQLGSLDAGRGRQVGTGFGRSVGAAGDVDGNGHADIFMGNNTANAGAVVLLGSLDVDVTADELAPVRPNDAVTFAAATQARALAARGAQSGTLQVTLDGAAVTDCAATVVSGPTTATCQAGPLPVGDHTFAARFVGSDAQFASSEVTRTVTVRKHDSVVAQPQVSAAATSYGRTGPVLSATVTSPTAQDLGGQAAILDGGTRLATVPVSRTGTVTYAVPALGLGAHRLSVQYLGTDLVGSSASPEVTVSVTKASLVRATKVRVTKHALKITLGALDNGAFPTGRLKVKVAGKTRGVAVAAVDQGRVKVKLPARAAKRFATVRYLGDATTNGGAAVRVRVRH